MSALVVVGLGPLGLRVLGDLLARGEPRLAAVVDVDPRLTGKLLTELDARAPGGLRVQPALDSIADWRGVDQALVMTSSELARCADSFRGLLRRGLAVVSSCEELAWPWLRHAALAQELDRTAREHGARLLGTGINPGFLMDALPLVLSGACLSLRSLRIERVQDARVRRLPFQKKIGAGLSPADFAREVAAGRLRHVGLGESVHFLAHYLGLELEHWEESLEAVLAAERLDCALGPILPGQAAGVRQVASARAGGRTVIELVFQATIGEPEPHDRIELDGDPPLDVRIAGGVHGDVATSALLLNALAALRDAPPGLHSMASIRPPHARFARQ
jgi:4-hydroxy-tetrahydrodipicolinate reductase